jgi:hypothetical protein
LNDKWSTPIKIIYKNIKKNNEPLKITFGIKLNNKAEFEDIKLCKGALVLSLKNLLINFSNLKLLLK